MFENFPYSNFHDLNTDWLVKKVKDVETSEANAKASEQNAKASEQNAKASELNASLSDASAQTWALQTNNSAQRAKQSAEASANSATEADNYVSSTRAQVNLLQSRVDNIIPSGTQTEGNTELLDIRVAEDGQIYDSAGNAVRGQVRNLKNALNSKVDLTGENQVTPQNLEGMQFTKTTGGEVEGENIFSESYLGENDAYANVDTAVTPPIIAHAILSGYRWYAIPVDGESKYRFTEARFACLAKGNTVGSEAIGTTNANVTELTATGASYLFLSYPTSTTDIEVHKVTTETIYSDFILPDWLVDNLPIPTVVEKPKFTTVTGDMASGGNLQLPSTRSNLRKGERIVLEGNITNFSTLTIGLTRFTSDFGNEANRRNVFIVDGTNITYKAYPTATAVVVPHGLTISENIQIIWEMTATASCKITLISDGVLFSHEFTNFVRQVIGNPFVYSADSELTGCKLTWTCTDINKSIWMFGDSYFAYSEARWTYYLHQYGYDNNCLLDGFPGEGGVNGRVSFNNLLKYGTPKIAVWCLGMNDGADSDSAPATNWVNARDYFLQYCTDNNITPIFGTIPTVPTINNEQKNAWIRSSGYRYIDFAKAVGANASGVWYGGMLSNDRVHPSESGAKALFAQVLIDLPEIMVGGYGTPTSA